MVRYSFMVRLFHPLLHAGFDRRFHLSPYSHRCGITLVIVCRCRLKAGWLGIRLVQSVPVGDHVFHK